jgi:hypothetical protein
MFYSYPGLQVNPQLWGSSSDVILTRFALV